jgi:hypothetical protein
LPALANPHTIGALKPVVAGISYSALLLLSPEASHSDEQS